MLFKSPVFSQASGSIAGITYSRNAGGMYIRSRSLPTNPNTEAQQAVRQAMATLVNAWTNTVTAPQREAWETYAFNTPTLNKLGEATRKTGQQMYLRSNIPRVQAGLTIVNDAPAIFDLGTFTPIPPPIVTFAGNTIDISFTAADPWLDAADNALLIYQSRPQNPSKNFFKGPYQLLTIIEGAPSLPPTPPVVADGLFVTTLGQKVFFRVRLTQLDGRLSSTQDVASIVE